MKLLHCLKCKDVKALTQELRTCECAKSKGRYLKKAEIVKGGVSFNAIYSGPAVLMGIANKEIVELDTTVEYDRNTGDLTFYKGEWIYIRPDKTTVLKVRDAATWTPLTKAVA